MMATAYKIYILLECPSCGQRSRVNSDKLPHTSVRVRCNDCKHAFVINRETSLNCKIISPGTGKQITSHKFFEGETMKWRVDVPMCKGLDYDLAGIGALIRGGLVKGRTHIMPPGAKRHYPAEKIHQLQPFFQQRRQEDDMIKRAREAAARSEEADSLDDSKSWYDLDCSDFFNFKVKPFMQKEAR